MRKLLLVARREFFYNLRRPAFLFSAFGSPLFVVVIMALTFSITATSGDVSGSDRVGFIDYSGVLDDAERLENPDFAIFVRFDDEAAARAALESNDLQAYVIVPENYMVTGLLQMVNFSPASEQLKDRIDAFLRANLLYGVDIGLPARIVDDPGGAMAVRILASDRLIPQSAILGLFLLPFLFVMVFMLAAQTVSGFLMNGIVEEKSNRIMEMLVTSVTPEQLLGGKIIGLGLLGIVQLSVWLLGSMILLAVGNQQNISFLVGLQLPPDLVILAILYFILAYGFLASLLSGIGAAAGSEQESRQYAGLIALLLFIPLFFIVQILEDPNGSVSLLLSFTPFTAPMTMLLRTSLTVVPLWQIVVSLGILAFSTLVIVWGAARVFRWGLLMYGNRIRLRRLLGVIFRRDVRMETSATQVQEG